MKEIIGRKMGMTEVFAKDGKMYAVTVIEVLPNVVTQVKTVEKDGYAAIQVGIEDKKESKVNSAERGHFKKAGVPAKKVLRESLCMASGTLNAVLAHIEEAADKPQVRSGASYVIFLLLYILTVGALYGLFVDPDVVIIFLAVFLYLLAVELVHLFRSSKAIINFSKSTLVVFQHILAA